MLVAIEGGDGGGKSTQVALLSERLRAEGHSVHVASFPRYADPIFGDVVRRFLKGDLGDVDAVDPRLVALLFAGDRAAEAPKLRRALGEGQMVVCDRYFYSNLVYQGAKLPDERQLIEFERWLRLLEFEHYALPEPACSIYLDVHQAERQERLLARAQAHDGEDGAIPHDIHERDVLLQGRVEDLFRTYAQTREDLVRIDCQRSDRRLEPAAVHELIWQLLSARGLLRRGSPGALSGA